MMLSKTTKLTLSFVIVTLVIAGAYFGLESNQGKQLLSTFFSDPIDRYSKPNVETLSPGELNPMSVALGKSLFFDPRLSGSNWISCSTCHNPTMGWSDGLPTAIGEGQNVLGRSTPTILNVTYNFLQMWDGRFSSLEEQALGPIEAAAEMNQDLDELVSELKAIPGYVRMFKRAFPNQGISQSTIALAIASFERTIVATEAPFDRWLKGDEKAISLQAKRGFEFFEGKAHCAVCHSGINFSDDGFHNIGVKSADIGRFKVIELPVTKGAFKTPTLRDITKTAPYMHNGMYKTLEEVVDHYVRGGDIKSNLSPNFKKADLNKQEVADLVAFLKTLTGKHRPISMPRLPI